MKYLLETIAFNIESCLIAERCGVSRIELCDSHTEGGTTPSYGFIQAARKKLSIDLFPIIRPRGGDFLYSKDEFDIMKADVAMCKNLGCNGIVIGLLCRDATVDKLRVATLVKIAYPMEVTFHRAFDRITNVEQALTDIIDIGCTRILTSGQYPTALEGIYNLKKLVSLACSNIIIMPGSGVKANNIVELAQQTGAVEFHSSARKLVDSKMTEFNSKMNENMQQIMADENEIKAMVSALKNL